MNSRSPLNSAAHVLGSENRNLKRPIGIWEQNSAHNLTRSRSPIGGTNCWCGTACRAAARGKLTSNLGCAHGRTTFRSELARPRARRSAGSPLTRPHSRASTRSSRRRNARYRRAAPCAERRARSARRRSGSPQAPGALRPHHRRRARSARRRQLACCGADSNAGRLLPLLAQL